MPQPPQTLNQFDSLIQVIRDLRGPNGCPWDQEQNHQSLAPYAIEETFEMVEAIEEAHDPHICEELGDVLFQVVLHAQLAEERQAFNISHVIEGITSKIVRRHPHVFSNTQVADSNEVLKNWEEIKKAEKANSPQKSAGVLNTPVQLPALQTANKIGEKTKKYKFDWQEPLAVIQQLKSEIAELEEALAQNKAQADIEHEMGDILFSAAQVARHLQIEPESNLRKANRRFIGRFEKMLNLCGGIEAFTILSPEQKEKLWQLAKKAESKYPL